MEREREREANRWVSDAGIEKRTSTGAFDECFYTHNYTLPHLSIHLKIVKQKGCDSCRATKTKKTNDNTHTPFSVYESQSKCEIKAPVNNRLATFNHVKGKQRNKGHELHERTTYLGCVCFVRACGMGVV